MTERKITIQMDQKTVENLVDSGFSLYAFKAVKSSIKGGAPLVWFQTTNYSTKTDIRYETNYSAFTSKVTHLKDGTEVTASATYGVDLGDVLNVTSSAGMGDVTREGEAGTISILNKTNTQFTCGISQESSEGSTQLCALPLFGNNLDVMVPIEKVLLTFATNSVDTGSVIYRAYAPSLMVDLTGETERTVTYDLNRNWQANAEGWARRIPVNADLVPLLIESSSSAKSVAADLTYRLFPVQAATLGDSKTTNSKTKVKGVNLKGVLGAAYSTTSKVTIYNETTKMYKYQLMTDSTDVNICDGVGKYRVVNNSGGTITYQWL